MKPTDDERREVAEKLREPFDVLPQGRYCHAHYTLFGMGLYASSEGALRLGVRRLADLIEPEERTCRNTCEAAVKGPSTCSACGENSRTWVDMGFGDQMMEVPQFCPNCGSKVVEQ